MRVVIAHGHIFKNAGSTFDWSLRRNFGDDFLDHRDDKIMRERGAAHLHDLLLERAGLRAISSHCLCQPLPALADTRFEPVYLLRHPLERIASVYAFERQQVAETPGARAARELNFQDYVAWRLQANVSHTIRDYQACNIAGEHETDGPREATIETLHRALKRLSENHCVGVVDRYDESMVVFEHYLLDYFPELDLAYVAQNVNSNPATGHDLAERVQLTLQQLGSLQSRVLASNSFDMPLYRLANLKLDTVILSIPDFEEKLTHFRQRCQRLHDNPL